MDAPSPPRLTLVRAWAGRCLAVIAASGLMAGIFAVDPAPPAVTDNTAAIAAFGVDPGSRINKGVVVIDATYIHPPYTVERRGLSVLLNGHLVFAGCEWPPFDPKVPDDPGDPPKGLSPVETGPGDSRMGYWSRKYRYLAAHHDKTATRDLMIEALRKSGFYKEVSADARNPTSTDIDVVDNEGNRYGIDFGDEGSEPAITDPKQALGESVEVQKHLAAQLRHGSILGFIYETRDGKLGTPMTWTIDHAKATAVIEILASPLPPLQRLDALIDKRLVQRGDSTNHEVLQKMVVDDELRGRLSRYDLRPLPDPQSPLDGLPDPWASLRTASSISCLRELAKPLADHPDDQHLLGLAIMAYVNLALSGTPELDGACGPWLAYAERDTRHRRAVRHGAEPVSVIEAAPEWWVQLIEGDAAGVEQALARFPDQKASPTVRALHALATRDWRDLAEAQRIADAARPDADEEAVLTPHEQYALLCASAASGAPMPMAGLRWNDPTLNPCVLGRCRWRSPMFDETTLCSDLVTDVAAILSLPDIADDRACRDLRLLAGAIGLAAPVQASRAALVDLAGTGQKRITAAITSVDDRAARIFNALIAVIDDLRAGSRVSIRDDGLVAGVGVGDLADWCHGRLQEAASVAQLSLWYRVHSYKKVHEAFGGPLCQEHPQSLIAAQVDLGRQRSEWFDDDTPPADAVDHLAALLAAEVERPGRPLDALWYDAISLVAITQPERAGGLFRQVLARERANVASRGLPALPRPQLLMRLAASCAGGDGRLDA